jgi:hypothetical protein
LQSAGLKIVAKRVWRIGKGLEEIPGGYEIADGLILYTITKERKS